MTNIHLIMPSIVFQLKKYKIYLLKDRLTIYPKKDNDNEVWDKRIKLNATLSLEDFCSFTKFDDSLTINSVLKEKEIDEKIDILLIFR